MADPLFGHDGRGDFHGVNLVEIDKTKLPFDKILTESSTLISGRIDQLPIQGSSYLLDIESESCFISLVSSKPLYQSGV
ncbi:tail fiber like protein [Aeromonas phage AP1]|nr:tail fiber like protein [Aeromonas phage AP1]